MGAVVDGARTRQVPEDRFNLSQIFLYKKNKFVEDKCELTSMNSMDGCGGGWCMYKTSPGGQI